MYVSRPLGSGSGALVMALGGAVQDEPPLLDDSGCGATVPETHPRLSIYLSIGICYDRLPMRRRTTLPFNRNKQPRSSFYVLLESPPNPPPPPVNTAINGYLLSCITGSRLCLN